MMAPARVAESHHRLRRSEEVDQATQAGRRAGSNSDQGWRWLGRKCHRSRTPRHRRPDDYQSQHRWGTDERHPSDRQPLRVNSGPPRHGDTSKGSEGGSTRSRQASLHARDGPVPGRPVQRRYTEVVAREDNSRHHRKAAHTDKQLPRPGHNSPLRWVAAAASPLQRQARETGFPSAAPPTRRQHAARVGRPGPAVCHCFFRANSCLTWPCLDLKYASSLT